MEENIDELQKFHNAVREIIVSSHQNEIKTFEYFLNLYLKSIKFKKKLFVESDRTSQF